MYANVCYIWRAMDPINKNPSHVSIFLPAPLGSVMGHDLHPKSPRFQVLTPDEEEDNGFEGGVLSSPGNPGEAAKPQHGDQGIPRGCTRVQNEQKMVS